MEYCAKPIHSRSRFAIEGRHRCFDRRGHTGRCSEFPYLYHLKEVAPKVEDKIRRDATNTTGAAWRSVDAGPNRILRWAMLLPDDELLAHGLDMSKLSPIIVAKLRDKKATYDDCMMVAQRLTHLVYGMKNAPSPPSDIRSYLEELYGPIVPNSTACLVCLDTLDFDLFARARRGKAEIESAHANPRSHKPDNVGFAHRPCNIAQGDKTLDEFYDWIHAILQRVGRLES